MEVGRSRLVSRYAKLIALTAAAVGIAYLLTRHQSHAWQWLPYVVLLACPLMHFFHHGRHAHRKIHGEAVPGRVEVTSLDMMSAHADPDESARSSDGRRACPRSASM